MGTLECCEPILQFQCLVYFEETFVRLTVIGADIDSFMGIRR